MFHPPTPLLCQFNPTFPLKKGKKLCQELGFCFQKPSQQRGARGRLAGSAPVWGISLRGHWPRRFRLKTHDLYIWSFSYFLAHFLQKRHSDAKQRRSLFWTGPRTRPRKLPGSAGINSFIQVWSQSAIVHLSFYGAGTLNFMAASQCQPKKLGSLNYARSEP